MKLKLSIVLSLLSAVSAVAGELDKQSVPLAPLDDRWRFTLAVPGFMAGVEGTVGVNGINSDIDVGFDKILPNIDMIWATRAEASKGRFGILGELIYLSMSGSTASDTVVKKVDVQVDEYLADFAVRWRLIEGERGYVDLLAGVRYTNIYQALALQANDQAINEVAENFTDELSKRLRERIDETLSEGRFRNALGKVVSERITDKVSTITGPDARSIDLPNAALAHRETGRIGERIERLVHRSEQALVATAQAELRQAATAEAAALKQTVSADRARLQQKAAALRTRVNQRVAMARKDLEKEIKKVLKKSLSGSYAAAADWWDPYVGVRARYNFTPSIYVIGRGDIGGFGVGSDLMWQVEGAIGFQLSRSIYSEIGYRALSFDYSQNGYVNETITHGAQVTLGITF